MKKIVLMMALFIISPLCAQAQGQQKPSAMESILAQKKPSAIQLELSRANPLCGGVMDCNEELRSTGIPADPCLWDKLACHMESFSRGNDFGQTWLVGGAKLRAEIGPVTFSVGRHTDNIILMRAPFIESSYRIGLHSNLSLGVLQTQMGTGSQNIWYVVIRVAEWE
jgi:hypothetical protein